MWFYCQSGATAQTVNEILYAINGFLSVVHVFFVSFIEDPASWFFLSLRG